MTKSKKIGPYKIVKVLGEGGMGIVYAAEQTEPVRRKVALKLIRGGATDPKFKARFEAERQALALMDHPNVARVYDSGYLSNGQPYFAMEHIHGQELRHYCDSEKPTLEERLELFDSLCRGVQHAHQRGVIHRDLKPGNILVTIQDERPVAKIIDFGLAKAVDPDLVLGAAVTQAGQLLGTLVYMSPEQCGSDSKGVDTRADVYALGLILYELVVGVNPQAESLRGSDSFAEAVQRVRDLELPSPARWLSERSSASTSENETGLERTWVQRIDGDLDRIVAKAVSNERDLRYESVADLGRDVRCYLAGDPVSATPPTVMYRSRKFVAKHRVLVSTAGTTLIAIIAALIISISFYRDAESARKEARAAQDLAEANARAEAAARERAVGEAARARKNLAEIEEINKQLLEARNRSVEAREETQIAKAEAREVQKQLGDALGLSKVTEIVGLRREADELWPLSYEIESEADDWILRASAMEGFLKTLVESGPNFGTASTPAERALIQSRHDSDVADTRSFVEGPSDRARVTINGTSLPEVRARMERVRAAGVRSNELEVREAWNVARTRVKSMSCYSNLDLEPRPGWAPLGFDPDSGLLELAWLVSGTVPERDSREQLIIEAKSAMVFVLLPGGEFDMGEQKENPFEPNYFAFAPPATGYVRIRKGPKREAGTGFSQWGWPRILPTTVESARVAPFLIGKHEITRAQWARVMDRPSPSSEEALLPQLAVSWDDAWLFARRSGFPLPTEAQWEFAARGPDGRDGMVAGGVPVPLLTSVNARGVNWRGIYFPKLSPTRERGPWGDVTVAAFDTGGKTRPDNHLQFGSNPCLPIGTLVANRFGLHDMLGNAAEWCRTGPTQPQECDPNQRVARGGSWHTFWNDARVSRRDVGALVRSKDGKWESPFHLEIGLRVAREWEKR